MPLICNLDCPDGIDNIWSFIPLIRLLVCLYLKYRIEDISLSDPFDDDSIGCFLSIKINATNTTKDFELKWIPMV